MQPGKDQVAVIGYNLLADALWLRSWNSGQTIDLNQRRYTIVGVMPASFRFTWDQEVDVLVPLVRSPEEQSEAGRGTSRDLQTQARLANTG